MLRLLLKAIEHLLASVREQKKSFFLTMDTNTYSFYICTCCIATNIEFNSFLKLLILVS